MSMLDYLRGEKIVKLRSENWKNCIICGAEFQDITKEGNIFKCKDCK